MSKRAIYSIPLAGLALTSFGCGEDVPPPEVDALASTLTTDVFAGTAVPLIQAAYDVYGDGTLICDNSTVVSDITFDDDLAGGVLNFNYDSINCVLNGVVDPASDFSAAITFNATVAVVTANTKYSIVVTDVADAANTFTLDCDLAAGQLDCIDDGAAEWAFTQQ